LGIYREQVFSPGKIKDDAAILDATLEELSGMGHEVEARHAESLDGRDPRPAIVLSMAQSLGVLGILEDWDSKGTLVINSAGSVRSCYRAPLLDALLNSGVSMPRSRMVTVKDAPEEIDLEPSGDSGSSAEMSTPHRRETWLRWRQERRWRERLTTFALTG